MAPAPSQRKRRNGAPIELLIQASSKTEPPAIGGNCTTEGLSATATTQNQLSGIGMLYDSAGNVTKDNLGNTPTYDDENRIATVAGYTYSYDGDGVRMEKSTGSSGTMYWPGPGGTLTESDLTGTINEEYVYFNGQRIARVDRPSGTVHYYFSNHLGSHTMVTSATGSCEQDIDPIWWSRGRPLPECRPAL